MDGCAFIGNPVLSTPGQPGSLCKGREREREREKERKGKGWVAKRMRRLAAVKGLPQQPKVVRKVGAFSQVGHNASNHYDPDFYFHHLHNRPSE